MIEINDSSNNPTNKVISKTKEEGEDKEANLLLIRRKGCFGSITFDWEIMYYINNKYCREDSFDAQYIRNSYLYDFLRHYLN